MSSSIAIPKRKKKAPQTRGGSSVESGGSSSPGSSSNYTGSRTFGYGSYSSVASSSAAEHAATPSTSPRNEGRLKRESLMSATFSKAEHTVVNVGDSESPRLITCVKASQGFDWNQEIFLPSYADYHFDDLERRQDPVEDIYVTDEEVKNMFPS
ncbi:hypothetical protein IQ07DRAFT_232139 [Pyrenochaeta sp. DS3sAY3a]|nr:hypothetical protein IQ07DRAFT_232139 [Pyrenochaeta sp. DS3sAY3a]